MLGYIHWRMETLPEATSLIKNDSPRPQQFLTASSSSVRCGTWGLSALCMLGVLAWLDHVQVTTATTVSTGGKPCPFKKPAFHDTHPIWMGSVLIEDIRTEEAGDKTERVMEGHTVEPEAFTRMGGLTIHLCFTRTCKDCAEGQRGLTALHCVHCAETCCFRSQDGWPQWVVWHLPRCCLLVG